MIWAAPVVGTVAWDAAVCFGRAARTFKPLFVAPQPCRRFTLHEDPFALGSRADLTNRPVKPSRPNWPNPFRRILQERKGVNSGLDRDTRQLTDPPPAASQSGVLLP